jgi:hypothetical protein
MRKSSLALGLCFGLSVPALAQTTPNQSPVAQTATVQYLQFSSRAAVPRVVSAAPLKSMLDGLAEIHALSPTYSRAAVGSPDTSRALTKQGITIIKPPPSTGYRQIPLSAVGDLDYNETSGIINTPAAKVLPAGSVMLGVEWQDTTFPGLGLYTSGATGPNPLDFGNALFQNAGNTHAIWGLGHNIELSVEALHAGINSPIFGGKWLAVEDDEDHPAFAIGVQSIGAKASNGMTSQYDYPHPSFFDHPSVFGVLGHTFALDDEGASLELDGGIGTGRLRNGFVGGELHFNKWIGLAADYDGTIESYALKFFPSDRFEVWLDAESQVPWRFGASIRYTLGATKRRGAPAWSLKRDTPHIPEPDVQMIPETNHLE